MTSLPWENIPQLASQSINKFASPPAGTRKFGNTSLLNKSNEVLEVDDPLTELDKLKKDPLNYVRKKIRDQIDDCLWLDELQVLYDELQSNIKNGTNSHIERCLVCTLPKGTCSHSKEWVNDSYKYKSDLKVIKNTVDSEIDDMLDIIQHNEVVINHPTVESQIDIHGMKWNIMDQRSADLIGNTYLCLQGPSERGWHSATLMDNKELVVFGGFRYK